MIDIQGQTQIGGKLIDYAICKPCVKSMPPPRVNRYRRSDVGDAREQFWENVWNNLAIEHC